MADQGQSEEDVLAAAVEAQWAIYEKETGNQREVGMAKLSDEDRAAVQAALDHHADRRRSAGRPGW
jgi:hypothetical protein